MIRQCIIATRLALRKARRPLSLIMAVVVSVISVTGCSLEDARDECCEEVVLQYRYVRQAQDEYKKFVTVMRHFLFNDAGQFIQEIPYNTANPQIVKLSKLATGRYTVVTVGNATAANTGLSKLVEKSSNFNAFRLFLLNKNTNGAYNNTDELFWSNRTFVSEEGKKHKYICDLSNIHCHLFVKVFWHNRPKYNGKYTMSLEKCAADNSLDPSKARSMIIRRDQNAKDLFPTEKQVVHTFPALTNKFCTHNISVPLSGMELQGELITLRYTNKTIPTYRLYFGKEPITKPIDLSRAFISWGWRPDEHPEQIYRIEMEIFDDGKVIVNQWADASVKDWQDGGIFGGEINPR